MKDKWKDEKEQFVNEWKVVREKGAKKYIISKMLSTGCMMALIYIINLLVSKSTDYLMVAVIYVAIIIIAPIFSWGVNEKRYCKIVNKTRCEE